MENSAAVSGGAGRAGTIQSRGPGVALQGRGGSWRLAESKLQSPNRSNLHGGSCRLLWKIRLPPDLRNLKIIYHDSSWQRETNVLRLIQKV